jgi:hypothetical protein
MAELMVFVRITIGEQYGPLTTVVETKQKIPDGEPPLEFCKGLVVREINRHAGQAVEPLIRQPIRDAPAKSDLPL